LDDLICQLRHGDRVLDVASASGSFSLAGLDCSVFLIDEDAAALSAAPSSDGKRYMVAGRCEQLPIASASIDLVICNHALEHFLELHSALDEIGRVLKPAGRLYVSVPNGYGVCDGIYRWAFEGGGHVNRFRRDDLIRTIESRIGVRLAQWQRLYSSFGYLRGIPDLLAHPGPDLQARLKLIARLPRVLIHAVQTGLYIGTRVADRGFGTSSAVYGWALWFDRTAGPATENPPFVNVCIYCGTGHPPGSLERPRLRAWACLSCGRRNRLWFG
jgi:SAM-dependent methyltransferase